MPDTAASAAPAPVPCFHGGAFFDAVGPGFDDLSRRHDVVNADVLDAWFDPAPAVLDALAGHLPWLLRTSPPTHAEGLVAALCRARGLDPATVVVGAGSSALVFLALPQWLGSGDTALLLDPTYGEYEHVARHVCGARIAWHTLCRTDGYRLDLDRWLAGIRASAPAVAVLVHPNNPTGSAARADDLARALAAVPETTLVWVDEAYADYLSDADGAAVVSMAPVAARRRNVVVCRSLSKGLALSGARAAYLVAHPETAARLRGLTPPWAVGLPAQVAAVAALTGSGAAAYYAARYAETHALRADLARSLAAVDPSFDVHAGAANAVLVHLPPGGPDAETLAAACRERRLFVRDVAAMGPSVGTPPRARRRQGRRHAGHAGRALRRCVARRGVTPPPPLRGTSPARPRGRTVVAVVQTDAARWGAYRTCAA